MTLIVLIAFTSISAYTKNQKCQYNVITIWGEGDLDNNWIVENLTNAFGVWTNKMTEMWSLLTESPQTFKGGTIWQTTEQLTNLRFAPPKYFTRYWRL